jgi:hypothetical protein
MEALILVAESNGGPTMFARIGIMRALPRRASVQSRSQRSSLGTAEAEAGRMKS